MPNLLTRMLQLQLSTPYIPRVRSRTHPDHSSDWAFPPPDGTKLQGLAASSAGPFSLLADPDNGRKQSVKGDANVTGRDVEEVIV